MIEPEPKLSKYYVQGVGKTFIVLAENPSHAVARYWVRQMAPLVDLDDSGLEQAVNAKPFDVRVSHMVHEGVDSQSHAVSANDGLDYLTSEGRQLWTKIFVHLWGMAAAKKFLADITK